MAIELELKPVPRDFPVRLPICVTTKAGQFWWLKIFFYIVKYTSPLLRHDL